MHNKNLKETFEHDHKVNIKHSALKQVLNLVNFVFTRQDTSNKNTMLSIVS